MRKFTRIGWLLTTVALCASGASVVLAQTGLSSRQRYDLIIAKWEENQHLGDATSKTITRTGVGAYRYFGEDSAIYVRDTQNAARVVEGANFHAYQALDAMDGLLGWPASDTYSVGNGTGVVTNFEGGDLLFKFGADRAYEIHGCHGHAYRSSSWEYGPLGYPTSDQEEWNGRQRNTFEFGRIYSSPNASDCLRDARTVFNRLRSDAEQFGPTLIGFVRQVSSTHSALDVTIGRGFTPNSLLSIFSVSPDGKQELARNRTVDAQGNVQGFVTVPLQHSLIKKINGVASLQAIDSGGLVVAFPVGANGGSEWNRDF